MRNAHIHLDRRSKAVWLSREECTIVLVVLLLFLLSFLCNQRSSCLIITGDMIYNHFFFCLSLESLRWHIYIATSTDILSVHVFVHHLSSSPYLNTPPSTEEWVVWDIEACARRKVRHVVACLITVIIYPEGGKEGNVVV